MIARSARIQVARRSDSAYACAFAIAAPAAAASAAAIFSSVAVASRALTGARRAGYLEGRLDFRGGVFMKRKDIARSRISRRNTGFAASEGPQAKSATPPPPQPVKSAKAQARRRRWVAGARSPAIGTLAAP